MSEGADRTVGVDRTCFIRGVTALPRMWDTHNLNLPREERCLPLWWPGVCNPLVRVAVANLLS